MCELRHTAASLLSDEGDPIERVADLLGHDGVGMLSEVYRHAVAPSVNVAAAPMERLLGPAGADRLAPHSAPSVGPVTRENDDDQGGAPAAESGP